MPKECTMLEGSGIGMEEEEEEKQGGNEIELSLELSIGGSYGKLKKSNPSEQKSMASCAKMDADITEYSQSLSISGASDMPFVGNIEMDPLAKREFQALRRQEARKKREGKLKKALCREITSCSGFVNGPFLDDKEWLKAQSRVRDRDIRENEDVLVMEPSRKKEKNGIIGNNCVRDEETEYLNLTLNQNHPSNLIAPGVSSSIPAVSMQCPYPPLKCLPFTNCFIYPHVSPGWDPVADGNEEKSEKFVFQQTACRSFRPYQGNRKSNGDGCSSSALSDYQSSSWKGDDTDDAGSNSSPSQPEQMDGSAASDPPRQSEHSGSPKQTDLNDALGKSSDYNANMAASFISQSSPERPSEGPKSESQCDPVNKPISTTHRPNPSPLKEANGVVGKPPRPQTVNHENPSVPQMPCVSTTGNGPNGKTITGFLYRYTKREVSIVCACHGTSFSPAEFVDHAGGIDIAQPLKHITVVPSAFR